MSGGRITSARATSARAIGGRASVRRSVVIGLLAVVLAAAAGPRAPAQVGPHFERSALAVLSGPKRFHFTVELARTAEQLAYGLMFREQLAANAGMLFEYAPAQPVSMWMKNTLIPLDMLFIDGDGKIVKVVQRTVPQSTVLISSDGPVRAVLELNGGTTARLGIAVGDRVRHPVFEAQR